LTEIVCVPDPERDGLHTPPHTGWLSGAAGWLPPPASLTGNATIFNASGVRRPDTGTFPFFLQGVGGPVSQFVPPASYWGWARPGDLTNPKPAGGGGKTYTIPVRARAMRQLLVLAVWACVD